MSTYDEEKVAAENKAALIAEHLDGFTYTPGDGNPRLVHEDGRQMYVYVVTYGANKGRVSISGGFPRHNNKMITPRRRYDQVTYQQSPDYKTEITVSGDKSPEKVAADITRRLLPEYDLAFADVQEQIAGLETAKEGRERLATRLAEILGTQARFDDEEANLYAGSDRPFYRIRVTDGDSVRFEHFSCNAEQAEKIIRSVL